VELDSKAGRAVEFDVMRACGLNDHGAACADAHWCVGFVFENEGHGAGMDDETSPDAGCNAVCSEQPGGDGVVVECALCADPDEQNARYVRLRHGVSRTF
jgi:hypothetical protein